MDNLASSRLEAISKGQTKYFTGLPCKRGGIAERTIYGKCFCNLCKELEYIKLKNRRKLNPEEHRKQSSKWAKNNRDKINNYSRKWASINKDKISMYSSKARAIRKKSIPKWFSELDNFVLQNAYELAKIRSSTSGMLWEVDHMIPINSKTACGLHCANNIQVIPRVMNKHKSNKMNMINNLEWIKEL